MKLSAGFIATAVSLLAVAGQAFAQENPKVTALKAKFAEASENSGLSLNVLISPRKMHMQDLINARTWGLVNEGVHAVFFRCRLPGETQPYELGTDISFGNFGMNMRPLSFQAEADGASLYIRSEQIKSGGKITVPVEYTYAVVDGDLVQITPENAYGIQRQIQFKLGAPVTDELLEKALSRYDLVCGMS